MSHKAKILLLILFLGTASAHCASEVSIWPEGSVDPALVVTHPSFLLYSPQTQSARAAVIVFPGGGYKALAIGKDSTIGLNGADICKWLTDAGLVCVLLKYRVPNSGCHWDEKTHQHVTPDIPLALQDAQRTISFIRFNAKKYNLDPNKIGVLGFSAGGNLAVLTSTAFNKRSYAPTDDIDKMSSRPDFAVPIYPGHMTMEHKNKTPKEIAAKELNTDIQISKEIPPTFLVHAQDDPVDPIHYSEIYEQELKKVGVNVKFIKYKTGGHAFGIKKQGKDTDNWPTDVLAWLKEIKILEAEKR